MLEEKTLDLPLEQALKTKADSNNKDKRLPLIMSNIISVSTSPVKRLAYPS